MQSQGSISVVTGAVGFVGRALVRRLLEEGEAVRAVVVPGDPAAEELRQSEEGEGVEIVAADVTDTAAVSAAVAGASRVFHAAALVHDWAPWERFQAVNVGGTQNVARAALEHGVERFVAISTSDVFGIPRYDGEPMDETSPRRRWNEPYADTKIEAEEWLREFQRQTDLPVSVIYPGWVYGPGDRAFFPGLAEAIRGGFMFFWKRGVRLPWVYVDNLADACVLAARHPAAPGQGYIVHDGNDGPTLQEVCARIAARIGARPPRCHMPYRLALASAFALQALWRLFRARQAPPLLTVDVKAFGFQWNLSNEKAWRDLGWEPRVPAEVGMARALDDLTEAGRV